MIQSVLTLGGSTFVYFIYWYISSLRQNIDKAKKSGLPYIVAPCSPIFILWQLTHKLWLPLITLLPEYWYEEWLDVLVPNFSYRTCHERFARHGDTFIVVSPGMLFLLTSNAEAIRQFTSRREHFPKLTEMYSILRQFGENVLTCEGATWRMHRKVTSATFNEKNAALVFRESIRQAKGLVKSWTGAEGKRSATIHSLEQDTMRLALHIIGYVGFGLTLLWPGETLAPGADPKLAKYGSLQASEGHKLSFVDTIALLLEHIMLLLLVPQWLLRLIPSKKTQAAADANEDFIKYAQELMDEKIEEARQGEHIEGMDLMGQLVRSSYGSTEESNVNGSANGSSAKGTQAPKLSRSDIIGNAFIMLAAGHETTANSLNFALLGLATNPEAQRQLHGDIDELLGDTDPEDWGYEALINPMMASMLGACMNETLRMLPPVVEIPKKVTPNKDQILVVDGEKYVMPRGTVISLAAVSIHRNPRYWPSRPSKVRPGQDDINNFVPDRWFRSNGLREKTPDSEDGSSSGDNEDLGGYRGPDTSAQLFRPERGAYIPFSDGPRSCLGRRIAQVEIIAALAVLFRKHSLELAVDQWAGDDEVEAMTREEKAQVYRKAQDESRKVIRGATSVLTLKLNGGEHVPVRFVRRGEEQFVSWIDS